MRPYFRRAAAVLALNMVLATAATAADIHPARSIDGSPLAGITIEGMIAPGDFAKLVPLLLDAEGKSVVWLASPGGNLSEALRMGALIRQLALEVRVPDDRSRPLVRLRDPENNTCASACFFLYVAGVRRQGSVLGIHKPTLPADEYFSLGLDGAVDASRVIREAVTAYLEEMGVPSKYSSLMLSTPNSDMVWLMSEDVRSDLNGVVAEYAERLGDVCPRAARPENGEHYRPVPVISSGEQLTDKGDADCMSARLQEMQEERRQIAVARLLQERE